MNRTVLSIAGISVGVDHRYPLTSWDCADHVVHAEAAYTVSASDHEILEEYERRNHRYDMEACENNCLYRKVCWGMLDYDGFLLHAAAVAVDGEGYVFTAPGGMGKSTHAAYWMQEYGGRAVMINGDKPMIRLISGKYYVCGTPWRGKERWGNADLVPLKAISLLEQARENAIEPSDMDLAADRLLRQVLMPEESGDVIRQLELLDYMIREIPVYHLRCSKSQEAARVAYEAMRGYHH